MAIALDASSNSGLKTDSFTWNHTCTGSNLVLVISVIVRDTTLSKRTVSTITYNGVALTKVRSDDNGVSFRTEIWYLINPATGSNTVSVTMGSFVLEVWGFATSLTGAKQSSQPDAHNGNFGATNSSSVSVTTIANNSWIIGALITPAAATSEAPSSGQVADYTALGTNLDASLGHHGPISPAGATNDNWSWSGGPWDYVQSSASFAPASGTDVSNIQVSVPQTAFINNNKVIAH